MDDGGAAFPRPYSEYGNDFSRERSYANEGMSLRDYFAAAALTGFIASYSGPDCSNPPEARAAEWAYAYADAMIARRANR